MVTIPAPTHDLIGKIAGGSISVETAREYFDLVAGSKQSARLFELLGFDEKERKAYRHAAGLEQLAHWRLNGRPTECYICGHELHISASSWFVCEKSSGETTVIHVRCLRDRTNCEMTGHLTIVRQSLRTSRTA
jgi:hypothetical protein